MANTSASQFPRTSDVPVQSAKYWVKEKDRYLRQLMIGDIQAVTNRPLFVYYAQLNQPINASDADDLAEIISGIDAEEADFFLQTPGGDVDATEKIVSVLRHKFKSYRVLVPSWAKSAGTVISLSASKILLGINSELGPIDPQFAINGGSVPCELIARDPAFPQHVREMAERAMIRMQALAASILKRELMAGKDDAAVAELLTKLTGYMSHGAVIDYDEAKVLGLNVEYLQPTDELWRRIWLLYCMYEHDAKINGLAKVLEGYRYSLARPI